MVDSDFLLYSLWVTDFRLFEISASLNRIDLRRISIGLPELNEQRKIAAHITQNMKIISESQEQLQTRLRVFDARKIGIIHRTPTLDTKPADTPND
ncbi:MAG: hypothetical protein IPK52_27270 [Chloroflexi bacterium]|nr:hypothetical protein [Chloroflexota bacterium]